MKVAPRSASSLIEQQLHRLPHVVSDARRSKRLRMAEPVSIEDHRRGDPFTIRDRAHDSVVWIQRHGELQARAIHVATRGIGGLGLVHRYDREVDARPTCLREFTAVLLVTLSPCPMKTARDEPAWSLASRHPQLRSFGPAWDRHDTIR